MVSITVSVPDKTKKLMKEFPEMNWSGFVKKSIIEKANRLVKLEELKKELEDEQDIDDWSVKLQRASRSGRLAELKKKGLI
ncbi:MAG: hypothetical protein AABX74_02945 [Nanoarchaeota archaeon]